MQDMEERMVNDRRGCRKGLKPHHCPARGEATTLRGLRYLPQQGWSEGKDAGGHGVPLHLCVMSKNPLYLNAKTNPLKEDIRELRVD